MSLRKTLLLATMIGAVATPALAQLYVNINTAPPSPRYERVETRPGYVWAPGYWDWAGRDYVWHEGYWMHARPGYAWVEDRWYREGRGWQHEAGHWAHTGEDVDDHDWHQDVHHDNGKHKGWYKHGRHD